MEQLIIRTRALKVGNGLEKGTQIGPAIDGAQLQTNLDYIDIAKKEGARLVCGGNRVTGPKFDRGYYIEPTIFTDVTPNMRIAQEEVFGPVLAVMIAHDFEDAMRLANSIRFGLSAAIVSRDLTRVHQFINRIHAGLVTVNLPTAGVEYQLPFVGTKESSFGGMREQGPQALDFYTESATVYLKYTEEKTCCRAIKAMERVDLEEVAIIRFAPGLETRILILIKVRLAKTSNLPKASATTRQPFTPNWTCLCKSIVLPDDLLLPFG